MSTLSKRILEVMGGDSDGLHSLANAIVKRDVDGVQSLLGARGIHADPSEIGLLMSQAGQGQTEGATMTMTMTMTMT